MSSHRSLDCPVFERGVDARETGRDRSYDYLSAGSPSLSLSLTHRFSQVSPTNSSACHFFFEAPSFTYVLSFFSFLRLRPADPRYCRRSDGRMRCFVATKYTMHAKRGGATTASATDEAGSIVTGRSFARSLALSDVYFFFVHGCGGALPVRWLRLAGCLPAIIYPTCSRVPFASAACLPAC